MTGKVEAQTSQFNSATPDRSSLDQPGDPADTGLQGEPELAEGRQQDQTARSCEGAKEERAKQIFCFWGQDTAVGQVVHETAA